MRRQECNELSRQDMRSPSDRPVKGYVIQHTKLDRTRRAWVAPARDGRYVLGQLRSRTAGVSFLSF